MTLTKRDIQDGALRPGTAAYDLHFPPLPMPIALNGAMTIDVEGLWNMWQPSQRDDNIHRPAVERYRLMIRQHRRLPVITIESIVEVEGELCIRTADGRHRITAAHEEGLQVIDVLDSPMVQQIKQIWGL